jgi:excisionase family DNA binding protein
MNKIRSLFTIRQASEAMNVGRSKVYYLVNSQELRCVRIGGSVRIPEAEIARYLSRIALEQHGEDITLSDQEEN